MRLFDTHCHINDERFAPDRDEAIARMLDAGVQRAVVVGDGARDPSDAFALAKTYNFLYAAAGVHPHDASVWSSARAESVAMWMTVYKVMALGEIGLDYHYDLSPRDVQKWAFDEQLDIALALKKPVILHIREAHGDVTDMLRARAGRVPEAIMHCFTGSWESAKTYLDMGMYISLSGALTFKNAPKLAEVAQKTPADRLLVETDCPYMAPVPMRGQRNEPAFVRYTLLKLAELRGETPEAMAETTYQNALRAFHIAPNDAV